MLPVVCIYCYTIKRTKLLKKIKSKFCLFDGQGFDLKFGKIKFNALKNRWATLRAL